MQHEKKFIIGLFILTSYCYSLVAHADNKIISGSKSGDVISNKSVELQPGTKVKGDIIIVPDKKSKKEIEEEAAMGQDVNSVILGKGSKVKGDVVILPDKPNINW